MMNNNLPTLTFATEEDASAWMYNTLNESFDNEGVPCMDDYTFAFKSDPEGMAKFDDIQRCCGVFISEVIVDGRPAQIGCSYDH
jgi:hypothetical protein